MKNHYFLQFLFLVFAAAVSAQPEITVIATGLKSPTGIDSDLSGNFFVAQAGTGQNDGEVSLLRPDGEILPFVIGLPSFFDTVTQEIVGTFRAQVLENPYIAVFNAMGIDTTGAVVFVFNADDWSPSEPLTIEDAVNILHLGDKVLRFGFEESNPYSMLNNGCDWFFADAGANTIFKRDGLTGVVSPVATLPVFPNPIPVGPPVIQPVPTRIIQDPDGGFLVSTLTGFPFLTNAASVWHVDELGQIVKVDSGYTMLTDIAVHPTEPGYLTLQYAQFDLAQMPPFVFNSAAIVHTKPGGEKDTVVTGFGPSAGMAVGEDEVIFVTEIFQGRVLKIDTKTTAVGDPVDRQSDDLMIYPNPASSQITLVYQMEHADDVTMKWYDMTGRMLTSRALGFRQAGHHTDSFSLVDLMPGGTLAPSYYVRLEGRDGWSMDEVVMVAK